MDYELLPGGDDGDDRDDGFERPPARRPVRLLVGAVAALGALVVVLLVFGPPGDWAGETRPAPLPSSPPTPGPVATTSGPPGVTDANGTREVLPGSQAGISVAPLCAPTNDGAGRLAVAFQVLNTSDAAVRLVGVRPRLPRPGLVRLAGVRVGGSCGAPGDEVLPRYLPASGRLLVTMQLRILDPCPSSAPFGVRLDARFDDAHDDHSPPAGRTLDYPLFADLGSVVFSGC